MARVPKSLSDAVIEEPERFIKYFKLNSINSSNNPYKEFLKQFERAFGKKQGLYLWQYILDNYDLTNKFYNYKRIQDNLPSDYKGNIDKKIVEEFFKNYKLKTETRQAKLEKRIIKTKTVSQYLRKNKTIMSYKQTSNKYNKIQNNFILARKDLKLKRLADEFNNAFGTKITSIGIRDKRYRLLGKKK